MARDGIILSSGSKSQIKRLNESIKRFSNGVNHGLKRAGQHVVKHAKTGIKNPPKTGVKSPGRNRSSKKGEFPADQTGALRKSVNFKVEGGKKRMIFGAKKLHGKFLELGTKRMSPREFIGRTVNETRKEVEIILEKALDEEIKRKL